MPSARLPAAPLPKGVQKQAGKLDIHGMFQAYNAQYFGNSLSSVYVEYSKKMTRCAGTCTFLGPHGGCRIGLSEPLLSLRPPEDTVATLLHEAIHASLFLKFGVERDSSDGHGPRFLAEAERISKASGVQITVFHDFTDEVGAYLRHWWRCDGCGLRIKRAMNRAPAPTDNWWPEHAKKCRGKFDKTHEPPPPEKPPKHGVVAVGASAASHGSARQEDIFSLNDAEDTGKKPVRVHRIDEMFHSRGGAATQTKGECAPSALKPPSKAKLSAAKLGRFSCPACDQGGFLTEGAVSAHLDSCLAGVFLSQAEPFPDSPKRRNQPARDTRPSAQEEDVILLDDDTAIYPEKPNLPTSAVKEVAAVNNVTKAGNVGMPDLQIVDDFERRRGDFTGGRDGFAASFSRKNAVVAAEKSSAPYFRGARAPLPWEVPYGHDAQSPCFLDVALGIGEFPDDIKPFRTSVKPSHVSEAARKAGSEAMPKIPCLPCDEQKPGHTQLMRELTSRIGLWEPNKDPFEAPFAGSAARHGLTPKEFMANLLRDGTLTAEGLVLSERGRQLFVKNGDEARATTKRSLVGSSSKNEATAARGMKRHRRKADRPIDVDAPSLSASPEYVPTKPAISPSPRSASNTTGVGAVRSAKQTSRGGIDSFFKSKASVAAIRPRVLHDGTKSKPAVVVSAPEVVEVEAKETMKCPICDATVASGALSEHLEACMGVEDSDSGAAVCATETAKDSAGASGGVGDRIECPICAERIPRSELERHTEACMARYGLDAAFD